MGSLPLEQVAMAVERRFTAYLDLLADLVRCPSLLGDVGAAQERLYRHLRQMGLQAQIGDIDLETLIGHPAFAPVAWSTAGQPNVWGILPGTRQETRSLVLNGHIDVVPVTPTSWWTYDPWGAEITDGRMYGRGALDMKGGLVAGLLAIQAVLDLGAQPAGDVIFESVIEEECTGNGMLARRLDSGRVDAAVILEPTGLQTWMATPGVLWFDAFVRGKPAYVGQASDAVNAIEVAAGLIHRLKPAVVDELNASFNHPAFANFDHPLVLNVGTIEGGNWPSNVPLECRFSCRMSYPMDWSFAEARDFVKRHLTRAASADPWLARQPPQVRFPGFRAVGWENAQTGELLMALDICHNGVTGQPLQRSVFPGTADARYFDAGAGEQVAYYGPGGGNLHAPDEYVDLESIRQVACVVASLILTWCGGAS